MADVATAASDRPTVAEVASPVRRTQPPPPATSYGRIEVQRRAAATGAKDEVQVGRPVAAVDQDRQAPRAHDSGTAA